MVTVASKSFTSCLITGANVWIGFFCCPQFLLQDPKSG